MNARMLDKKIDYSALEHQRTQALQDQLKSKLRERQAGKDASLRRVVLAYVVEAQYDEASETIDHFIEMKSIYPALVDRATPHANHAKELINAIRLKRNFPNLSQLSMSKQQEILDHAVSHFEELKMALKVIEHLTRDEAVKDIRSTVWVIRCTVYVVTAVFITAFALDFHHELRQLCWNVFNDLTNQMFDKLSHFL